MADKGWVVTLLIPLVHLHISWYKLLTQIGQLPRTTALRADFALDGGAPSPSWAGAAHIIWYTTRMVHACIPIVHGWLMVGSWLVPGWLLVGEWLVHGWFMAGSGFMVHGWLVVGAWLAPGWFLVGAWLVPGL